MKKNLLIKYLNDKCSEEELRDVIEWIKNDAIEDYGKALGESLWKSMEFNDNMMEKEKYELLLGKIHNKIVKRNSVKEEYFLRSAFKWLSRAAAILFIPILILLIYTNTHNFNIIKDFSNLTVDSLEIVTPVGSQTVVQLSDGSEVYLNHGSKLKYPQEFSGRTREVVLIGEGYFNVVHNPEKPFIVKTSNLTVTALGTSFNVMSYPDENVIEATLVEGKLLVEKKIGPNDKQLIGTMIPNQHISFNKNSDKIISSIGDVEKYVSWKDGKLIFKNESIVEITKRLSRWYNVDFDFKDSDASEYTYTATFVDETLFQILDLMKIATPINYKTVARKKLPDGTYTKQHIIIEKNK